LLFWTDRGRITFHYLRSVLAVPTAYIALSFFFHVRKHGSHPDPYHHDNEPFHLRAGSGSTSEVKGVERV
jgi:hypothetical protein